jgi:hypothetical protein
MYEISAALVCRGLDISIELFLRRLVFEAGPEGAMAAVARQPEHIETHLLGNQRILVCAAIASWFMPSMIMARKGRD